MATTLHNRRTETLIYLALWLLACAVYVMAQMRLRMQSQDDVFGPEVFVNLVITFTPYVVLFVINNWLLIPRLLLHSKNVKYLVAILLLLSVTIAYLYFAFAHHIGEQFGRNPMQGMRPPHPRPLIPLPIILDSSYALLIVGINMANALLFQRFDYKLERESLLNANAQSQLANLKAQINPHFYMNMLNNIHGMIEIDAAKAQTMVLDMSRLMRYMLYDSSRPLISLHDEVDFLRNYLSLMRMRYPESRVAITSQLPDDRQINGYQLPPLLFLVFVENAFKHGVSYRHDSFVSVKVEIIPDRHLHFSCLNSLHTKEEENAEKHGIGLRNVRQRLKLIYGEKARLNISETSNAFTVDLQIPFEK